MAAPPLLLRRITRSGSGSGFPFTVPVIATLDSLEFTNPVTFFAGGNGTGKSTLLEAIAVGTKRVSVSRDGIERLPAGVRALAGALRFEWVKLGPGVGKGFTKLAGQGFFLRAEDFLDYKRGLVDQVQELHRTAASFEDSLQGYGLQLARASAEGQVAALTKRYGEDLDAMSHGESFLQFFRSRFTGPGLYLLDEPDTALSPLSVLGLMAALGDMAREGAQFIVATHNPILLSFPGAAILSFDRDSIEPAKLDDLEQVRLVKDFLRNPGIYLRELGI